MSVVAVQLFRLYQQKTGLNTRLGSLQERVATLQEENEVIEADIDYFQHPENLSKELKSKFDYKRLGEELFILIPQQ